MVRRWSPPTLQPVVEGAPVNKYCCHRSVIVHSLVFCQDFWMMITNERVQEVRMWTLRLISGVRHNSGRKSFWNALCVAKWKWNPSGRPQCGHLLCEIMSVRYCISVSILTSYYIIYLTVHRIKKNDIQASLAGLLFDFLRLACSAKSASDPVRRCLLLHFQLMQGVVFFKACFRGGLHFWVLIPSPRPTALAVFRISQGGGGDLIMFYWAVTARFLCNRDKITLAWCCVNVSLVLNSANRRPAAFPPQGCFMRRLLAYFLAECVLLAFLPYLHYRINTALVEGSQRDPKSIISPHVIFSSRRYEHS